MSQKQLIAKIAKKINKECPINKFTLEKFIALIKQQKDYYESIDYLSDGGQSLVLKATNTQNNCQVALKIIDCSNQNVKQSIQGLKNEYELLKKFSYNDHLVKIFDCFYLQDDVEEDDEELKDQDAVIISKKENVFFVLELEVCQYNLKKFFLESFKSKQYPDQVMKEQMAIQMLDGLNSLHIHSILHRDIKPQNFLVTKENKIKLSDLGFACALTISKSHMSSIKGTQTYFAPEVDEGQSRIQTDLFALGLTLLELDNLDLLNEKWISKDEMFEIYQGKGILTKRQINRQSNLYSIIEICLKPNYNERMSATELIQILLSKQQKEIPFLIYSVLIKEQLEQQAKYLIEQYNSEQATDNKKYQVNEKLFVKLISQLFDTNKYNQSFQFVGFGSEGFVLATKSLERKQEIVLKVKEVESKKQIETELNIMKEINMSLVVQLYESYYIYGLDNKMYVVYEFEKCQCTLQNFLDRTLIDGENEDQKLSICHQIMASINYLHHFDIIHNDIKPDNYLVTFNDQDIIVKLSDFGVAVKLSADNQQFITQNNFGSWLYQAPELFNSKKTRVYTKKTDIFSVGCVLTLVDNYMNFFQPQLYEQNKNTFIYPMAFVNMIQTNFSQPFDPSVFLDKQEKINRKSQIYKYIHASVVFDVENRKDFNSFISSNLKSFYKDQAELQKIINKSQKNLAPDLREFKIINNRGEEKMIQIDINCQELSLQFSCKCSIGDYGATGLGIGIGYCQNITNLTLDLRENSIGDSGAAGLGIGIGKCQKIRNLKLNLMCNSIGESGAIGLGTGIVQCQNISNLRLDLYKNRIGDSGATSLGTGIGYCQNIITLTLDLQYNSIGGSGAAGLGKGIGQCQNITNLTLDLYGNIIGDTGATDLVTGIKQCQNIINLALDLRDNNISDSGAAGLGTGIGQCQNITNVTLDLQENSIGDSGAAGLGIGIGQCQNITNLTLNLQQKHYYN